MRIWEANGIYWFDPWWLMLSVIVVPYVISLAAVRGIGRVRDRWAAEMTDQHLGKHE